MGFESYYTQLFAFCMGMNEGPVFCCGFFCVCVCFSGLDFARVKLVKFSFREDEEDHDDDGGFSV